MYLFQNFTEAIDAKVSELLSDSVFVEIQLNTQIQTFQKIRAPVIPWH